MAVVDGDDEETGLNENTPPPGYTVAQVDGDIDT